MIEEQKKSSVNLFESRIFYYFIFAVYKVLIEFTYYIGVSHWYSYLGFILQPNYLKCLVSYILFSLCVLIIPRKYSLNGVLVSLFFSISTIPMLSFFWLADKELLFSLYAVLFFCIMACVSRVKVAKLSISINDTFTEYELFITIIFFFYVIACVALGTLRGGIDFRAISFSSIYQLRSEEVTSGIFEAYVSNWCAKAFFPMLTVYYLYTKRRIRVIICLVCQLYLYLCYGYKAYILSAVLTIVVFFVGRFFIKKRIQTNCISLFILIAGLIPCWLSSLKGIVGKIGYIANNTYAMRMLFEPARIANGYFSFFSSNDKLFFSEGLIGKIFGLFYPYDTAIGFVITKFLNGEDAISNSNTGIVADSFSQIGFAGIILIALVAGLLILYLNRLIIRFPTYCIAAAFFYPVVMLNDNPLLTNILTNGWFIDIIMLFLFEKSLEVSQKNSEAYCSSK